MPSHGLLQSLFEVEACGGSRKNRENPSNKEKGVRVTRARDVWEGPGRRAHVPPYFASRSLAKLISHNTNLFSIVICKQYLFLSGVYIDNSLMTATVVLRPSSTRYRRAIAAAAAARCKMLPNGCPFISGDCETHAFFARAFTAIIARAPWAACAGDR
ncbi:hypothetical protein EVAR_82449_1 [Eumeta japonica]|uniref:Uncharacterized protein n=1 Tax=Eumeta variegata TaxID=151549 RepID=A0A4C1X6F0_EUMVA|nr:hypothetical protein EVAR_82449_1 [Eumeta japonica]